MSERYDTCGTVALLNYIRFTKQRPCSINKSLLNFRHIAEEALLNAVLLVPQRTFELVKVTPCIVKSGEDHFILVTNVWNGYVYYLDRGFAKVLPLDDLPFKGEVLSERMYGELIPELECENIVGHKKGKDIFAKYIIPTVVGFATGGLGFGPMWAGAASAASRVGTSYGMQKRAPTALDVLGAGLSGFGAGKFGAGFRAPGVTASTAVGGTSTLVKPTLWQRVVGGGRGLIGSTTPIRAGGVEARTGGAMMQPWGRGATGKVTPGVLVGPGFKNVSSPIYIPAAVGGNWQTSSLEGAKGTKAAATTTLGQVGKKIGTNLGMDLAKKALLGGGLQGVGASIEFPEPPNMPYEKQISERIFGGSPLSQLSEQRAMEIMQGDPLTSKDRETIKGIFAERKADSISQVKKRFQQIGRADSGEARAELAKTERYWDDKTAQSILAMERDAMQMQSNMVQASFGYSQDQVRTMLDFARETGDIEEVKYLIRVQDTMGLRNMFDKLAQLVYGSSTERTIDKGLSYLSLGGRQ